MLQPFKYQDASYEAPQSLDYSQKPMQADTSGLTGLLAQNLPSKDPSVGGGPAALAGIGPDEMGPVAELAAAEQTEIDDGSGWMSKMFGDNADPSAGKKAMSNPWTALAAVIFNRELFGKRGAK